MPDEKTECEVCLEYLKDGVPTKWHVGPRPADWPGPEPGRRPATRHDDWFCVHDACLPPGQRLGWEPAEGTPEHAEWEARRKQDPGYEDPGPS